jgi:hypothetical protein
MSKKNKVDSLESYLECVFPNHSKLIEEKGFFSATIIDAELDPVPIIVNGVDETLEMCTRNLQYVQLTEDNLRMMLKFLKEATKKEKNQNLR